MNRDETFRILAFVHARERPVWQAAEACLTAALGGALRVELLLPEGRTGDGLAGHDPPAHHIVCVSLLPALLAAAGWDETEADIRGWFGTLLEPGLAPVCICTVFRHLPAALADSRSADGMRGIERVRRLNLLAARLSQESGITVIDLDRSLAHAGARTLDTDCFLGGSPAEALAGAVIASTVAENSLDGVVPDTQLESARRSLAASCAAVPDGAPPAEVLERLYGRGRAPDTPLDSQATASALLAAGDIDGAETEAVRLCILAPNVPGGFVVHARCAEARRDWELAEKRWRLCVDRFPGRVWNALPGLATMLTRLGRFAEAREVWDSAHAAAPEHPQPFAGLGNLAARDKDHARAVELYRRALDAAGGKPPVHWRMDLARELLAMGDAAAALAETHVILELAPDYQPALNFLVRIGREER